ncbi:polysaccharide pyruvyl transferase family protein [Alteromonas sp. CYL-A6]|uniref:polysaccharide pyruvyl transferase family protein n=1 Tax=Alteromonas nitratireducens TaxID=3390813 RepID=UPI0034BAEFC0
MFKRLFSRQKNASENVLDKFVVDDENLLLEDGEVPLTYWVVNPNFGDLLSPWLFTKLTGKPTKLISIGTKSPKTKRKQPTYIAVGSILSRVQDSSVVWGTGSFGTEQAAQISSKATYHAVRGPLTRSLVKNQGGECPAVYGDPALLAPLVHKPDVKVTHEIGVVLRWSETAWLKVKPGPGIKVIDLGTDDIEKVIDEMRACKRIVTSSLHGLIIADAYGIPNAWLSSGTPKGGEFKFFDYFLSVDKVRYAKRYHVAKRGLTVEALLKGFTFDGRPIHFDAEKLLDACPFLKRK